jgi:hypothetical protein
MDPSYRPPKGTIWEEFLYQADARARGVEVLKTGALLLAALGKPEDAGKAYIQYIDAVFPENEASREAIGGDTTQERLLEKEVQKVYQVIANRQTTRVDRMVSRPIDTSKQFK